MGGDSGHVFVDVQFTVYCNYDMIRYDTVYLRALKSRRDDQPNLALGTETKN